MLASEVVLVWVLGVHPVVAGLDQLLAVNVMLGIMLLVLTEYRYVKVCFLSIWIITQQLLHQLYVKPQQKV